MNESGCITVNESSRAQKASTMESRLHEVLGEALLLKEKKEWGVYCEGWQTG